MRIGDWNVAPQPQQRWKSARSGKKGRALFCGASLRGDGENYLREQNLIAS